MKAFVAMLLLTGCAFDPMSVQYHETQQNEVQSLRNQETVQVYWDEKENK